MSELWYMMMEMSEGWYMMMMEMIMSGNNDGWIVDDSTR